MITPKRNWSMNIYRNATTCFSEMVILIPAPEKPPFKKGDYFYCNICQSYTPNFSPSHIKKCDRRCRTCLAKKRFEKYMNMSHLQRLKRKLYQNLIYQRKNRYAKSLTVEMVKTILERHSRSKRNYRL